MKRKFKQCDGQQFHQYQQNQQSPLRMFFPITSWVQYNISTSNVSITNLIKGK
jgi:hypothetical protein